MNRKYFIRGSITGFVFALLATILAGWLFLKPSDINLSKLDLLDLQQQPVNTAFFNGKPTVVNFWATWCAPCLQEMPDILQAREKLKGRVNFVFVSDEKPDIVAGYLAKKNFSGNFLCTRFPLDSIGLRIRPTTFFYDENGILKDKHSGPVTSKLLEEKYN